MANHNNTINHPNSGVTVNPDTATHAQLNRAALTLHELKRQLAVIINTNDRASRRSEPEADRLASASTVRQARGLFSRVCGDIETIESAASSAWLQAA